MPLSNELSNGALQTRIMNTPEQAIEAWNRGPEMSDLINRSSLMADRVSNDPVRIAAMCAPSVDAVEVVRCADCRHLYFKDMSAYCPYTVGPRRPSGFCDIGEQR